MRLRLKRPLHSPLPMSPWHCCRAGRTPGPPFKLTPISLRHYAQLMSHQVPYRPYPIEPVTSITSTIPTAYPSSVDDTCVLSHLQTPLHPLDRWLILCLTEHSTKSARSLIPICSRARQVDGLVNKEHTLKSVYILVTVGHGLH
jgi:hypothetical protein